MHLFLNVTWTIGKHVQYIEDCHYYSQNLFENDIMTWDKLCDKIRGQFDLQVILIALCKLKW